MLKRGPAAGCSDTYHLDLLNPVTNGKESLSVGDVIHQQNSLRSTKVRSSDGAEPLLPCSIPDLQLYSLIVQLDILNFEVDTDGGDEGGGKCLVRVSK